MTSIHKNVINNDKNKNKVQENILEFNVKTDQYICNSLRRIMISEVPIYAIERVLIKNNNSVINDEMLSHRLGLLPLIKTDNLYPDQEFMFSLDVSYDQSKADVNNIHTIYSKDLINESETLKLVNDDIIIAEITKDQSISLIAYAVLGNGLIHAKWSPSCGTTYIDHEDNEKGLTFKIETTGSIKPIDLYNKSIDILLGKIDNLIDHFVVS